MPADTDEPEREDPERAAAARRRLAGFGLHLAAYFMAMIVLVPVNMWLSPDDAWFVLPMVGWGTVLAVHVAYVMGLFNVFRGD